MTDIAWPVSLTPASASWKLMANTGTFGTQAIERSGDRWGCMLTLPVLTLTQGAILRAFLASLRGAANRAVLPNHAYVRRGTLTVNLLVDGGGQSGSTLVCDGGDVSLLNAVRVGDLLTLVGRLYMVAADADTDSTGAISITLAHPLANAPADGATVNVLTPTGRFIFTGSPSWMNHPLRQSEFTALEFVEDIP